MPVDRPTFSESWYRIAILRPRLRTTVQVYRQHYRGRMWHVLQDPTSNQFFRLNESAYRFVALLDGRRNIAEVWDVCNDQLGDEAPTQGEAIQLLGQLYTSNLLQGEMPPDAEGLLQRFRKRRRREIQGRMTNIMFIHVPLYDPNNFLNRWLGLFGAVFSWWGLVLWAGLLATGFYFLAGHWDELIESGRSVLKLKTSDLPLLYVGAIIAKIFHEFGHAFACKKFGSTEGGGEVHEMGIMFLIFTPLPYVDASSAWALRSKLKRMMIGGAGMVVELAIAAIAAIIWTQTPEGSIIRAMCYNVMFIASISSLLFNGNFLLRYDAYYIVSDWLEIPNLAPRSKQYLYYLVKRYIYGVRRPNNPAHVLGERIWFVFYGIASTMYRVIICVSIILMISQRFFFIGAVLAVGVLFLWVVMPLGKFVHYLATSTELMRVRSRAVGITLAFFLGIFAAVGFIDAPDRMRIEGVIEPVAVEIIHAKADGFIIELLPSDSPVVAGGEPLIVCENPELAAALAGLVAERDRLVIQRRLALLHEPHKAAQWAEQIDAKDEQIDYVREQMGWLQLTSNVDGVWVAPNLEKLHGAYVRRGDPIGMVVSSRDLLIRATASQEIGPLLIQASQAGDDNTVEVRVRRRPDDKFTGTIDSIINAGQERLPSASLGYAVGGKTVTAEDDPQGLKAAERFFEVRIRPDADRDVRLLSGQRVVVRLRLADKPLGLQWWRSIQQLIQRRFHIL